MLPTALDAWFAVLWLGLLGSGMAFLIFFRLLGSWGATRTSLVAYVIPVFGLILGAAVLNEPVDARMIVGTALIIGGIALVNLRRSGGAPAPGGGWGLAIRQRRRWNPTERAQDPRDVSCESRGCIDPIARRRASSIRDQDASSRLRGAGPWLSAVVAPARCPRQPSAGSIDSGGGG